MARQPSAAPRAAGGGSGRKALIALRIGITLLASLGGVAVYLALSGSGFAPALAVLLGLAFALLARQAASSLVLDALVRRARQARDEQAADSRDAGQRSEPSGRAGRDE